MGATINKYSDAEALWARCRNKEKGKPLTNVFRLFKVDNDFVVNHYNTHTLTISPDNSVTVYHTPPLNNFYVVPLISTSYGTRRSRIDHAKNVTNDRGYTNWDALTKTSPEFYSGIKFDLVTGECLNRKPDLLDRVLPEKSLEWRRTLARYTKGIKLRSRLLARGPEDIRIYGSLANTAVVKLMVDDDYPDVALDYFTAVGTSYNDGLTPAQRMVLGFKRYIDRNRDDLRIKFGVFKE